MLTEKELNMKNLCTAMAQMFDEVIPGDGDVDIRSNPDTRSFMVEYDGEENYTSVIISVDDMTGYRMLAAAKRETFIAVQRKKYEDYLKGVLPIVATLQSSEKLPLLAG